MRKHRRCRLGFPKGLETFALPEDFEMIRPVENDEVRIIGTCDNTVTDTAMSQYEVQHEDRVRCECPFGRRRGWCLSLVPAAQNRPRLCDSCAVTTTDPVPRCSCDNPWCRACDAPRETLAAGDETAAYGRQRDKLHRHRFDPENIPFGGGKPQECTQAGETFAQCPTLFTVACGATITTRGPSVLGGAALTQVA